MATKKKPQININPPEHVLRIYRALKSDSVLSGQRVCEAGLVYLLEHPEKMGEAIATLRRFEAAADLYETDEQCVAYARRFRVIAVHSGAAEPDLRRADVTPKRKRAAAPKKETAGG